MLSHKSICSFGGDFMPNAAPRLDAYEQHSLSPSYQPRFPRNSAYHKLIAQNYEDYASSADIIVAIKPAV